MTNELAREQCVKVCPQCEGEGTYADGLDEAACSTECTRCGSNGWIVDLAALRAAEPAADMVGLLLQARSLLANSGAESGYCMCGDPVESHTVSSGHAPVDAHGYMASQLVESIDAALQSQPAEPTQEEVERVARAIDREWNRLKTCGSADLAEAAIRALRGGAA